MSDIIQNLLNDVLQDGARPTKYRAEIILPSVFEPNERNLDIICKSINLPMKTNEIIPMKYKGRNIPIPGQETFAQILDCTFYLDAKHKNKMIFDQWMQGLNTETYSSEPSKNVKELQSNQDNYGIEKAKTSIKLTQLNFEGDVDEVAYVFHNVFPKEIGQVSYSSESVSALAEFNVSFVYTHYDIIALKEGINADNITNKILGGVQGALTGAVNSAMGYLSNTDIVKAIDGQAAAGVQSVQDAGKSIGTSIDEFLG